nr:hypothetical protein [Gemmatimonadaceae bacterium]
MLLPALARAFSGAFSGAFAGTVALTAPDTTHYDVFNHGRPAGAMRVVVAADSVHVRFGYQDRQRGPDLDVTYRFLPDGTLQSRVLRTGNRITGAAPRETERSERRDGRVTWRAGSDTGSVPA